MMKDKNREKEPKEKDQLKERPSESRDSRDLAKKLTEEQKPFMRKLQDRFWGKNSGREY